MLKEATGKRFLHRLDVFWAVERLVWGSLAFSLEVVAENHLYTTSTTDDFLGYNFMSVSFDGLQGGCGVFYKQQRIRASQHYRKRGLSVRPLLYFNYN
jgi:hypothetical protein